MNRAVSVVILSLVFPFVVLGAGLREEHQKLMHEAIRANNVKQVRKLLATPYVDVNDDQKTWGARYLSDAVLSSSAEMVQLLLDEGADLFAPRGPGYGDESILVAAICMGPAYNTWAWDERAEKLKVLINAMRAKRGREFVKEIVNKEPCRACDQALPLLVCLVNYVNPGQESPLYEQSTYKTTEADALSMVSTLMEAGADPNLQSGGETVLTAVRKKWPRYTQLIKFLVRNGAK